MLKAVLAGVVLFAAAPARSDVGRAGSVEFPMARAAAAPLGTGDWSGRYAGGDMGYVRLDYDPGTTDLEEAQGFLTGLHAGYQRDLGRLVLGAEVEHLWGNVHVDGGDEAEIERMLRGKLRLGYDAGRFLPYGTAGVARAFSAQHSSWDGSLYGAGIEIRLNERFGTGVEILRHGFEEAGPGGAADVTTIAIRGTFRF
jgi:opacity protein-like surface antigen